MPTKDPRKLREKRIRYYRKHRYEQLKRKAAYRETHRESIRARDNQYRIDHLQEIRKRQRKPKRGRRARQKVFRFKDSPKRIRQKYLKQTYGITPEEFDLMFERQDRKCAICQKDFSEKLPPCVDHKKGGSVRSLLCNHCNLLIGHAAENADLVRRAADYLETLGTFHMV